MSYILWLLLFVLMPTIFLWSRHFNLLIKYKKTFLYAIFFAFVFSIPWDILAVRNNIWFFPKEGNLGIFLGGLPLEEYLFVSTVTLFVATLTVILKYREKVN